VLHTEMQPIVAPPVSPTRAPAVIVTKDWKDALPILEGDGLSLRELRAEDGPNLRAMLTTKAVTRYIDPPPATEAEFQQFIKWTHRVRSLGRHACFGVIPTDVGEPVGVFQVWRLDGRFGVAEWGFVLAQKFWGSGTFEKAADLMLEFAFETLGVRRLEGRSAVENVRGNGALQKIGAEQEGILRQCFECQGRPLDHVMWAILADQWRMRR
jgi:ribosomal-protein-alanine N-acetyltransferase